MSTQYSKKGGHMEKLSVDTDVVNLAAGKASKTASRQTGDAFRGLMKNISENQNSAKTAEKDGSQGKKSTAKQQKSVGTKGIDEADRMSVVAAQMNMRTKVDCSSADEPEESSGGAVPEVMSVEESKPVTGEAEIVSSEDGQNRGVNDTAAFAEEAVIRAAAGNAAEDFSGADRIPAEAAAADVPVEPEAAQQTFTTDRKDADAGAETMIPAGAVISESGKSRETDAQPALTVGTEKAAERTGDITLTAQKEESKTEVSGLQKMAEPQADGHVQMEDSRKAATVEKEMIGSGPYHPAEATIWSNEGEAEKIDSQIAAGAQMPKISGDAGRAESENTQKVGDEEPVMALTGQNMVKPEEKPAGQNTENSASNRDQDDDRADENEIYVLTQDGRIDSQLRTQSQFSEIRAVKEPAETAVLKTSPDNLGEDVTSYLKTHLPKQSGSIELILNPENLGRITIRVSYASGNATIDIHAANPETLRLLTQEAARMGQILRDTTGNETKVIVAPPEEKADDAQTDTEARSQNRREADENQNNNKRQKEDSQDRFLNMMRLGMV